ncbi:hypothetical protein K458DRAFT_385484 [Lentithecium fluviatile CBS 122367]|uniref:Uncharacterized protein n=1 Tax=Lentithecium fluviatile CBS 122367 TaxID=1168545 RepID=A0A6G1JBX1_9PLEO|nr:hypothetical protein K458DRAFT_385484 [Lentithecium fluviatile CBS 122367]
MGGRGGQQVWGAAKAFRVSAGASETGRQKRERHAALWSAGGTKDVGFLAASQTIDATVRSRTGVKILAENRMKGLNKGRATRATAFLFICWCSQRLERRHETCASTGARPPAEECDSANQGPVEPSLPSAGSRFFACAPLTVDGQDARRSCWPSLAQQRVARPMRAASNIANSDHGDPTAP